MSASHLIALMMAVAGAAAAPAMAAEDPAATPAAAAPAAAKTDKLICRSVEVLGSRLKSNKVCMTSSEWAEQRRLDRMNVDKAQRFRTTQGN